MRNTRLLLPTSLFLAMAAVAPVAVAAEDFGDHKSSTLTTKAWEALGQQKYATASACIAKCRELYEAEALKQQAGLKNFLPADKGHDAWALNDVGTCYFIEGQMLEKQGKLGEAAAAYRKLVKELSFCQCWDTKGWFWRPAEAAADRLKQVEFDTLLDAK